MKRLILTLLVSVAGFAAIVSYGTPNTHADNTICDRGRFANSQEIRNAPE